ncbi:MAG: hypothetical protein JWM99_5090 [Verrucomicrobiales bacterium]|nr:hypothetical protein [Verrucomicrobiales bacterium]
MLTFLRFVGVTNAAIWLGALVFFTIGAGPAFFSNDMLHLLGRPHAGAAAQIVLERYFDLQIICSVIALGHAFAERLYTGQPIGRFSIAMLGLLLGISLLGRFVIEPQMKQLHLQMYAVQTTPAQKAAAKRTFGTFHGGSQIVNLLVIAGVLTHFWQTTGPGVATRRVR